MFTDFYRDIDTLRILVSSEKFQKVIAANAFSNVEKAFRTLGNVYISLSANTEAATEALQVYSKALMEIDHRRKVRKFWKIAQG